MKAGSGNELGTRQRAKSHLLDALPVKPGVLEVLDLLRQVAPVPHQFQISFSYFRVFCFLRCEVVFQRLYPEPLRSRRHEDQRGAIRSVPSICQAALRLGCVPFLVPAGWHQETSLFPRDDLALAAMHDGWVVSAPHLPA